MRYPTLLLIASAAILAACSSKEGPKDEAATGGTFIIAGVGEAVDVFPPFVTDINGAIVQTAVFDKLAEIGPDLSTVGDKGFSPRLAKSWSWAPDSMSIAFSIDPKAKWHDGRPVTASDIRYSFKLYTDPKVGSPVAPTLANVDSVTVRDSLTAVAWFKKHAPEQFYDIAYQLIPVPEHVYGSIPLEQLKTSEATRNLVGSGRFRFVKWEPKVRIELVADTSNYRGRPKLDRIILTPVGDPTAGMAAVLTGQADFLQSFPIDQAAKLDSSRVMRPVIAQTTSYAFLSFNPNDPKAKRSPHPIFSDIRVRRALSMGVDRAAILRNVFGDRGRLSHGPFPMGFSFSDSTVRLPAYDTTAAKALLDSAGWRVGASGMREKNGRPLRFNLLTPSTSLLRKQYSVLLQETFRRLGAQVDIEQMDGGTWDAKTRAGEFDTSLDAFNTDPSVSGEKQSWSTSGIGGQNKLKYSNPKVDALLDSATLAFHPATSKSMSSRAFQQIIDDAPAIFLYDLVTINAVHKRMNAAPMRPDGWFYNITDWSVDPGKRIDRDRIGLAPASP